METKRPYIRVGSGPPRGGVSIPSLGEGSGYYSGGSRTPVGVRDSAGVRTSTGGPEPPVVRVERLLLPEHVVLPEHVAFPDLSQPGDRSGTVVRCTGLRPAGVRLFGCSQG